MPLITETYYLSLTQDNRGILRLRCSQDDTLRTVNLKLYNNGSVFVIPSGVSASISGVKQNGAVFSKPCTISQDRKSVVLQLSSDITNVDGIIVAEIVLNDGEGGRLGASNFIIQIEKNPIRAGVVQDTEAPIEYINDFIEKIQTLTARLNNLITPSGDPSLAEVVDARISSLDGNTYPYLKARIDADIATLNTNKANAANVYTKSQVDNLLENVEIDVDNALSDKSENPVQNKIINRAIGEIKADLDALTEPQRLADGTDLDTVITSGVYTLYANNSYLHKPTADSEHGILEVWKEKYGDTGRTFQRLTYTYKTGRTNSEIWVRSKSGIAGAEWAPWINVSNMSINDVGNLLQSQTGIILKVEGSYINLTTDPVSLTPVVNAVWAHSVVSCAGGDAFIINADGGQMPRAWGFLDSSNHVLSVANESTIVNGLKLTAPTNAVKLIINDRSGATSYIVGNNLASSKVDVQQSPGDYGKALIINRNGQVRPGTISGGSGLTDSVRVALLACFRHVLWDDEHSVDYYNALEAALYAAESRLTAVIDYGNATVYADDPLSKVKWLMKVYYDGEEISSGDYTLTGNMNAGQNVLTITYNDESTSIIVEAEEKPASRPVLTTGDLLKFNGWGMSSAANGHKPPYLVSEETARVYYSAKGHAPYMDENNNFVEGVYPIPIPADATHVRVSVVPHDYKIALNCWIYNNKTHDYSFISGTDTGFSVWHADVDIPQYSINARALNIVIAKQDASAISSSEEPTEVVVQFT